MQISSGSDDNGEKPPWSELAVLLANVVQPAGVIAPAMAIRRCLGEPRSRKQWHHEFSAPQVWSRAAKSCSRSTGVKVRRHTSIQCSPFRDRALRMSVAFGGSFTLAGACDAPTVSHSSDQPPGSLFRWPVKTFKSAVCRCATSSREALSWLLHVTL